MDRDDETTTVTGIAGDEVSLQEFTNELQCDCYAGLEGSAMCPCRVVAAKRYQPEAIAVWLGNNAGGSVRSMRSNGKVCPDRQKDNFRLFGKRSRISGGVCRWSCEDPWKLMINV